MVVFIRHQAGREITGCGLPFDDLYQPTFADRPHPVDITLQRRPAVENVDIIAIAEPFFLQHRARRGRLRVHFANDRLRLVREEVGINRMLWHQFGDKRFLPGAAEKVSSRKLHREKAFPQALPERGIAVLVDHAAHFRDHFFIKTVAKRGHKHEARFRQQITVALFTPVGIEEQRAQLTAAGVIVTEKQRRQRVIDVQLF